MPGSATIQRGNLLFDSVIQQTITPAASVTAGGSTTSTYTITGLQPYDCVNFVAQAAITAPLSVGATWVSAPNVLSVQWTNASASTSSASPTAILVLIEVCRMENAVEGISAFPSQIF